MPLNEKKILEILLTECDAVEKRCKGYRKELIETITDVITYEQQHRIQATNIKQKVSDKCNALAVFLYRNRNTS